MPIKRCVPPQADPLMGDLISSWMSRCDRPLFACGIFPFRVGIEIVAQRDQLERQLHAQLATELLRLDQVGNGELFASDQHGIRRGQSRLGDDGQELAGMTLHAYAFRGLDVAAINVEQLLPFAGVVVAQATNGIERRAGRAIIADFRIDAIRDDGVHQLPGVVVAGIEPRRVVHGQRAANFDLQRLERWRKRRQQIDRLRRATCRFSSNSPAQAGPTPHGPIAEGSHPERIMTPPTHAEKTELRNIQYLLSPREPRPGPADLAGMRVSPIAFAADGASGLGCSPKCSLPGQVVCGRKTGTRVRRVRALVRIVVWYRLSDVSN